MIQIIIDDIANKVRSAALTGLSLVTGTAITASDTVITAFGKIQKQISDNLTTLTSHTTNTSNPHSTTATQVGLGNVNNTSDADKPVSTATQTALNLKQNSLGFTPEDVANKQTDLTASATKYPTVNAVNTGLNLKQNKAVAATGVVIDFTTSKTFGSVATPETGNITDDLSGAIIGVVQKIYHNNGSAPTVPAGWANIGSTSYVTSTLNIIYCEFSAGSRVEYWIA